MTQAVHIGEVAYVKLVDKGKVHLGVGDVKVSLKVAGILHSQNDFFLGEVVLAEDI